MKQVIFDSLKLRIACISDTHNDNCYDFIPQADILIHAGDFTDNGTIEELHDAYDWIKVKVIVAGALDQCTPSLVALIESQATMI